MKIKLHSRYIKIFSVISIAWAQQQYISPEDIKNEWRNYTSFQKQELVNFATFLYDEGFYERALLTYFQYLYKYPQTELEMAAYFQIAKCYEKLDNWDLAKNYYNRIIEESLPGSLNSNAAKYQIHYADLMNENYDEIIANTLESRDPYEMIFRGYAHFENLEWKKSKQSFQAAESLFDHKHYSKLINAWYKAIKSAENAPLKKKTPALLSSIFPGGGFIYLDQKKNAIGLISSTILLYSATLSIVSDNNNGDIFLASNRQKNIPIDSGFKLLEDNPSISKNYLIPKSMSISKRGVSAIAAPLTLALGLQFASGWKSVKDIDGANKKLVKRFTKRVTTKLAIARFMDYPFPEFILK
jgi:tetratricopeptide (TPR) repeat protein